jgi:carboxyl-terminal processing protease
MSDPVAPPGTPPYGTPPSDPEAGPRSGQPAGGAPSRAPIYVALFVVAALSGAALFTSGFSLGAQQAVTPGTSAADQQLFTPFWEAFNKVTSEYVGTIDERKLVEGSIKGLFDAIEDPYSGYMTSEEYRLSLSGLSGQFEGIGAEMSSQDEDEAACAPVSETCRLVIVRVIRGSPALAAGLEADDVVLSVDEQSVIGSTLEETVAKVRGQKGTPVKLGLERGGRLLDLTIVRDVIDTEEVRSEVLADGQVGYLKIDGFSSSADDDFVKELRLLVEDQGVDSLILDLRDDPGGFVNVAQTVASQFIAEGPIYWQETADGRQEAFQASPDGVATDPGIELVLLVNGGSASASEIVAGALQDTGRATLLGETTFGKGTIQQWIELSGDNGGFRLSVAKWLTPDKTWVHETGITPDVVVPRPEDTPAGEDPQLDRALELLTRATGATDGLRLAA